MALNHHDGQHEALQRLAESIERTTRALLAFADALSEIKMDQEYRAAGWPFGGTDEAIDIWYENEQWTTVN